ncbi:MAG: hypothetical protein ACK40G_00085 [Cytophagaceae bacterium]
MKQKNYYIIAVILTFIVLAKTIDWWQKSKTEEITLVQFKEFLEKEYVKEIAVFKKEKFVVVVLNEKGLQTLKKKHAPHYFFNVLSLKQLSPIMQAGNSFSIYEYESRETDTEILKKFRVNL